MSKLVELSNLSIILENVINDLQTKLINSIKQIKIEYNKNMVEEKVKLLEAIANDEKLNFEKLKLKYLKTKEIKLLSKKHINEDFNTEILDKIIINEVDYYYDTNSNLLYDVNSCLIGSLDKNKEIILI